MNNDIDNELDPITVRYCIGNHPNGTAAWRSLRLATTLMRKLVPEARVVVMHEGEVERPVDGVEYIRQPEPGVVGRRHTPPRLDPTSHEVYLDCDHIMWGLPRGWHRFRESRRKVLIWNTGWSYYGRYTDAMEDLNSFYKPSAGCWGLPPMMYLPRPVVKEPDSNQDEMGFVAYHLVGWGAHAVIDFDEVSVYCPSHSVLGPRCSKVGTHGVHLMGLTRGWNAEGEKLLAELEKEHL